MSSRLTQPEEVELALREMEMSDTSEKNQNRNTESLARNPNPEIGWNTGHFSAYRAAYIKTHGANL